MKKKRNKYFDKKINLLKISWGLGIGDWDK
jgi:hypothetical protein